MLKKQVIILLSAVFLSVSSRLTAQIDYQALNQYIAQARVNFGVTGLAVGIVQNGDIVFQNGYGLEDIENENNKVTTYSTFAIASLSKAFTATALSVLVDQGKLSWSDKVTTHLSYFKLNDPIVTQLITVEDLLCHRSGLKTFDGDLLWYGSKYDAKEIIKRIAKRPLEAEFRTEFGYQNIMYIAAAQIIEKVTGITWQSYLQKYFFDPLGMTSSVTSIHAFKSNQKIAHPHISGIKQEIADYSNGSGAVGIHTTVNDMTKWLNLLLFEGKVDGDSLFSNRSIRSTFEPRLPMKVSSFDEALGIHFKAYALGWKTFDYDGKKVMSHGGGLPGYISQVAIVPEEKLGIILLSNDMTSLTSALLYKLLDEFLGKKGKKKDWAVEFAKYEIGGKEQDQLYSMELLDKKMKKPVHSLPMQNYVGFYEDSMYGTAEVRIVKNNLQLTLLPSNQIFRSEMEPWDKDLFKVSFNDDMLPDGLVTFNVNQKKVESFNINLPNPDFHFYKLKFVKYN